MQTMNLYDASQHLEALANAAALGEEVIIQQNERRLFRLVPYFPAPKKRVFGSVKGELKMRDDFNAPLADFSDYMP